ncbi:hypothetical protein OPU71_06650 [Niveibacterium sp. 24ML]|uniref:DUF6671 family protein n=1 Tax=Niveibacterium sp. 24ML TaxID=2985512 RepID=UPI002271F230|nr:DUF6671 family protein [Niveibacterium sp. 24ML]MCX9155805.1 hypothetical protein [Niveibacterium sp. 24ML]
MIGTRIASRWQGQTLVIPTLHRKGLAIGAALGPALGVEIKELPIDTDRFGTFSMTVPRPEGALAALSAKVSAALKAHADVQIVVASEGSFGPHPSIPWLSVNLEYLRWHEARSGFELTVSSISLRPMHLTQRLTRLSELDGLLERFRFPAHGLMVAAPESLISAHTAITNTQALRDAVAITLKRHGAAELRSELRAHLNPTRMRHIERAAWRLANRLRSACPACAAPGFGEPVPMRGRPCAACGFPSSESLGRRWRCLCCAHQIDRLIPGYASPLRCPLCNP